ncbi:IS200/IS605 family accessory protein TnpB-related protein [Thermus filiformis]|uniref:IS200/IS605 family accessory protein TnpB-related protein n=1 Tax=Thermus filiformis TaxID=276 RepID=UPI0009E2DA2D|nr:IS200/IS605 family accessory protein TnpB-related protein [Thermus filiformis]
MSSCLHQGTNSGQVWGKKKTAKGSRKINTPTYYVGVSAKLVFSNKDDESLVLQILRIFSAAVRFAFNRLVEGVPPKDLWSVKGPIGQKFGLDSYYIQAVLLKAQTILSSAKERGIDPRKVVFGGRRLFEDLKKNHNPKLRSERKKLWKERRQGLLYCRGNSKVGNPNLKLFVQNGILYLRINVGEGKHVKARIQTSHPNLGQLVQRALLNRYYNVELTLKDGKIYANFTWEEAAPAVFHNKRNGVLALDLNANPYHIALALLDRYGNLKHYFTIPLDELDQAPNRGAKETLLWMVAHEVTDFAAASGVAIATENLKYLRKSRRGDGSGRRFRGIQHRFAYASLLRKIHTLALKKGIQVIHVDPRDTSTIGMLKYAPQLSLSKDVAAAYVIGRRALGIEEKLPKNYQALLEDPHFLENAKAFYRERVKELKGEIEKERNEAQKLRLTREKTKAEKALVLLSPKSSHKSCGTDGRNSHSSNVSGNPWRVLRVGLFLPFLGLEVPRDLSPLKPILTSSPSSSNPLGPWERGKGRPRSSLPGSGRGDSRFIVNESA